MFKQLFSSFMILSQMTTFVMGCDRNDLDTKVDHISGKLHDAQPISKELIRDNLDFIYDMDSIRVKYKKPDDFQSLWEKNKKAVPNNNQFLRFADFCKELYEEGTTQQKSAVHILFEKVTSRVQDYATYQQRRLKIPELSTKELKQKVQDLLNIDRVDSSNSSSPVDSQFKSTRVEIH